MPNSLVLLVSPLSFSLFLPLSAAFVAFSMINGRFDWDQATRIEASWKKRKSTGEIARERERERERETERDRQRERETEKREERN